MSRPPERFESWSYDQQYDHITGHPRPTLSLDGGMSREQYERYSSIGAAIQLPKNRASEIGLTEYPHKEVKKSA